MQREWQSPESMPLPKYLTLCSSPIWLFLSYILIFNKLVNIYLSCTLTLLSSQNNIPQWSFYSSILSCSLFLLQPQSPLFVWLIEPVPVLVFPITVGSQWIAKKWRNEIQADNCKAKQLKRIKRKWYLWRI